jgi:mono/diheme cytochrome c family protein
MTSMTRFNLAAGIVIALTAMPFAVPAFAQDATVLDGVFSEDQAGRGNDVFKKNCQTCHGPTLRGTPGGPSLLGARFNSMWKDKTVADMYTFIHDNMPAGKPASLQPQQYIDVVAFILSKAKYPAGETELPPEPEVLGTIKIVEAP